ncbi:MAG: polymer-forming cytoskeletal protein [Acidobacteriota bacterium]|jgi:cytoskeletal protein CcmA (bactofilin family)
MWKKSETEDSQHQSAPEPALSNASMSKASASKGREHATIGSTISITGDLTGEEDLLIEGKLEGKIECHRHSITVGKNGRIKGDIYGRIITVEGTVEGNLFGDEQLRIRQSGAVRGNIVAPRVALEDGANFKGSIDMSPKEKSSAVSTKDSVPASVVAKVT